MKQLADLKALRSQSHVRNAYKVVVNAKGDFVLVEASNSRSAAATAKKAGYEVISVSMIG